MSQPDNYKGTFDMHWQGRVLVAKLCGAWGINTSKRYDKTARKLIQERPTPGSLGPSGDHGRLDIGHA